jgi:Tfp pilus assembly protein PilV
MRGFTLIEVVVAIVLLELGLLGVLGTLVLASRTMTRAETLERAVIAVERARDSLSVHGMDTEGGTSFPGGRMAWSVTTGGPEISAVSEAGDTLVRSLVPLPR